MIDIHGPAVLEAESLRTRCGQVLLLRNSSWLVGGCPLTALHVAFSPYVHLWCHHLTSGHRLYWIGAPPWRPHELNHFFVGPVSKCSNFLECGLGLEHVTLGEHNSVLNNFIEDLLCFGTGNMGKQKIKQNSIITWPLRSWESDKR